MTLRDLSLPADLEELGPMLAESFQYPENPDWGVQDDERESLIEDINSLRRWWWMINIAQLFSKKMRGILPGKVWIEDGKIAGAVLYQRRGSSDNWLIGTVATHPDYRRRGIAHKLVKASLEDIQSKNAKTVVLDVIDANLPAYQLYTSLGFEHFTGTLDLEFPPSRIVPEPEFPAEYRLVPTNNFDWQARYQISKRISPENLQRYDPVTEALFQQPSFMRLIIPIFNNAQKIEEKLFVVEHIPSNENVGYFRSSARQGGKGRHTTAIRLDPKHAQLARPMLEYALHQVTSTDPNLVVEMALPAWQKEVAEAAYEIGFEKRVQYHRLGLKIEKEV
ncbi:MAG: GNAT family N-acetyltransferase [Anaerolineales bacterium]